jgi:hypothetical protein
VSTSVEVPPSAFDPTSSELRVEVPGDRDHVRVVRLVAADAADRAGFDCDRADDVRIAVDELCHAVMASTDAPMTVRFVIAPGRIDVHGHATRGETRRRFALCELSERILRAVSDSFELREEPSGLRFTLRMSGSGSAGS